MSDLLLLVIVWLALLMSLYRIWQRRQWQGQPSLLIWSVFLFAGAAFIFRTSQIEGSINQKFGGLPVAYYIKALFVLAAVGQYHRVLCHINPPNPSLSCGLLFGLGVAWASNTALLLFGPHLGLSHQQLQYSMMTLSDLAVLLNMALLFLPLNWEMYLAEQLEPMRMKHIATLTFCVFYVVAAAITQVAGPYTILTGEVSPLHDAIPLGVIVCGCFLVQVLPHRMLHKLLYCERVYHFVKLRQLERRIVTLAGGEIDSSPRINWLNEKHLQAATYITCINILDYSAAAARRSVRGDLLYRKIRQAASPDASYLSLIQALARLA